MFVFNMDGAGVTYVIDFQFRHTRLVQVFISWAFLWNPKASIYAIDFAG